MSVSILGMLDSLQSFWPIAVIAAMMIAIYALTRQVQVKREPAYEAKGRLITAAELRFFRTLDQATGTQLRIYCMVRIADLLKVRYGIQNRQSWQNKINCKHIDFVLCDPDTLEVLVAIELDDPSHNRPDRIKRDDFVNQAFKDAAIPLLRIPTADHYDVTTLRSDINKALGNPE